jgi:hypothetical protein
VGNGIVGRLCPLLGLQATRKANKMSPTNWTGIIAICTILGTLGGLLLVGFNITAHFVRLTDAVEQGGKTMGRVEVGMEHLLNKIIDHDDRFVQTERRLDKLEDVLLTANQQAEGIVGHVMDINRHKKRRLPQ